MARLAEGLPVRDVPEEVHVPTVADDVVDAGGKGRDEGVVDGEGVRTPAVVGEVDGASVTPAVGGVEVGEMGGAVGRGFADVEGVVDGAVPVAG
jgi:hypothetical protein